MDEVVDRDWIRKRIGKRRGLQARLASYLGLEPDKMTKIMNGSRKIQGSEVLKIMQFFDELDDSGSAAFTAEPATPQGSIQVAVANGVIQVAATISPENYDDLIDQLGDALRMAEKQVRMRSTK